MSGTITVNGEPRQLTGPETVAGLLQADGTDMEQGGLAVALNGEVVPRVDWQGTRINPDDTVEIVHIVRGG
jgi:sulfur carrier protein